MKFRLLAEANEKYMRTQKPNGDSGENEKNQLNSKQIEWQTCVGVRSRTFDGSQQEESASARATVLSPVDRVNANSARTQ